VVKSRQAGESGIGISAATLSQAEIIAPVASTATQPESRLERRA
jgi:hypothetical protein